MFFSFLFLSLSLSQETAHVVFDAGTGSSTHTNPVSAPLAGPAADSNSNLATASSGSSAESSSAAAAPTVRQQLSHSLRRSSEPIPHSATAGRRWLRCARYSCTKVIYAYAYMTSPRRASAAAKVYLDIVLYLVYLHKCNITMPEISTSTFSG